MTHISLHSLLGLGLAALVAGCAADRASDTEAATADLSAESLRFSSSTLAPFKDLALGARAGDGALFASYIADDGLVIVRSDDAGVHWTALSTIEGRKAGATVVASPSDPDVLYVTRRGAYSWGHAPENPTEATWPGGLLLRSDDGGKTWLDLTAKLPDSQQARGFATLDINPTNPLHLVAASCNGVQKSVDGGSTWRTLPGTDGMSMGCNSASLYRGINDRKTIYALYDVGEGGGSVLKRTYDDGVTWQDATQAVSGGYGYLVGGHDLVVHPDDAKHIYITDISSFFSSADGGDRFIRHSRGLGESPSSVAVNPKNGALYVTEADSVFRWSPAAGEPENGHWVRVARVEGAQFGAPAILNERLYVTTGSQLLIAPL